MTSQQIRSLRPALSKYLDQYDDCFVHPDTRHHLKEYVEGQLSDLPRKSIEPIARLAEVPPRTLQEFFSLSEWDEQLLRSRLQQMVAREHCRGGGIGIIDESGHPKKGNKTACVQRQYCGNTGKIDNCVTSVHLSYASYDNRFRTMLDSDLFIPEKSWADPARRKQAGIPDEVVYRPKYVIGLEQLDRAAANGVGFDWITADEWYAGKPLFLSGLEERGLRFVLEIPRNLSGWLHEPDSGEASGSDVENLCRYSRAMMRQAWTRFHVKQSEKGAMVWEAKAAPFWMRRGGKGVGPYWLVMTRDVLDPATIKYFLSNAAPGTPLEAVLHVAFSRWPVERCLEDQKTELGLSHFECRKYGSILRHLLVTQISHLFLARQTERIRGEKSGGHDLPGARRLQRAAGRVGFAETGPEQADRPRRRGDPADPEAKRIRAGIPRQSPGGQADRDENPIRGDPIVPAAMTAVAL